MPVRITTIAVCDRCGRQESVVNDRSLPYDMPPPSWYYVQTWKVTVPGSGVPLIICPPCFTELMAWRENRESLRTEVPE